MASDSKSTVVKVRPSNQDSKGKLDSSIVNKKKAESSTKQPFDSKQKSVTTVTKTEVPIWKVYCFLYFFVELYAFEL
jgi:hypothetical protein